MFLTLKSNEMLDNSWKKNWQTQNKHTQNINEYVLPYYFNLFFIIIIIISNSITFFFFFFFDFYIIVDRREKLLNYKVKYR